MLNALYITKSKLKRALFGLYFSNPEKEYYVRELERILGFSAANIRRDLVKLLESGLFNSRKQGNLVYYSLNKAHPLYGELKSIVSKTIGIEGSLQASTRISFGTDGWRGIIADDFTFDNVMIVTQAVCDYLLAVSQEPRAKSPSTPRGEDLGEGVTPKSETIPSPLRGEDLGEGVTSKSETITSPLRGEDLGEGATPTLIIGYDTRFLSDQFAREAACVAAGNGITVLLTDSFAPTPAVSYAVVDQKTDGAIMFTASHNPYRYNGLKFKAPYGGSATSEITDEIERHLEENIAGGRQPIYKAYDEAQATGAIRLFDPKAPYIKRLSEIVDTNIIRKKGQGAVIDPMFGAGRGYLGEFLKSAGCDVLEIHDSPNPYFGGGQPEPLGQYLPELTELVMRKGSLGVALDGDADRLGAIDQSGVFINSHQIFSLLLRYLFEVKGLKGDVVKTVSTTGMVDLLAADYGLTLHETPIGFKYICDHMLAGDVLIGGEESGGIGIKGHIPERDGMLMGALLVEMTSYYGKTLVELWTELEQKHGAFCYDRIDLDIDAGSREAIVSLLSGFRPKEIAGVTVERINAVDSFKYCLTDNSWLMIRPSGTEAVVRIYAEAGSPEHVTGLLQYGQDLIKQTPKTLR